MKAIVVNSYGGPEVLRYEDVPDPIPGPGEVLLDVIATSVNPIDLMRRSGAASDFMPIHFPGIIGVDVSGTVVETGDLVQDLNVGDRVFGMAQQTYAERCVVKSSALSLIPQRLDSVDAAALPLVTITGHKLINVGTAIEKGQTILILGAAGNVGRSAVLTAKEAGATVIAGVLKKQVPEAEKLGADQVVATDDEAALNGLPPLDAVADTVGGSLAASVLPRLRKGGIFASVLGLPQNADAFPDIKKTPVYAEPNADVLAHMAQAVCDGKLVIPIRRRIALSDAAEAHAMAAQGGGKIVLVAAHD